ncbi:DNA repair protein RecO [Agrobacterium rhizogenes]|uniref:DNA repair protein RecO n=2 Tax=Rhizobium rhizogenes TaxID=359 RepID=RECO_RHIR8|nr:MULTISPECIES: DNA repair protein RecO [Rhizobium]B9JC76.1 RecName: Full=DNA repair protein RecO; AltName: Full=Recombination protein O [Rhizobium rhizogenes K84]KAA6491176.1 DNA repair protein RecO [Agrobacterium sp. ICMP 7243]OCJ25098.1 DNA repair protein RecO [Agrobacterium sp. B131/95]ACM25997.1 DNA repair protein RecO [Rhizobium rhizogenes K84]EJK85168.1 DNA repair protein RecO [Rhizobium sp. AP16]MDJ1632849.1 DNA repair protein RecO [Rhizobium rhizogenes]
MQWQDHAIILGVKRLGETSVIAEVMTRDRGRHMGLVRSGRSRSMQPVLQPGNLVEVTWRARLHEHLGEFRMEPVRLRAARLMETATAVYGVQAMGALLRLLPERDPHPYLYDALDVILENMQNPMDAGELFVRFELAVLNELGYGLDLGECAATGVRDDLAFVSPKTGRAVCRTAGAPWADKMLALPPFLAAGTVEAANGESLAAAFRLTGFFLHRHVYEPRGIEIAAAREGFIQAALKAVNAVSLDRPDNPPVIAAKR